MTDRELLILAAKAADKTNYEEYSPHGGLKTTSGWWNPLTDDGDALRLAVKLKMDISQIADRNCVEAWIPKKTYRTSEKKAGDHYAATRRAIVRAAAEIGNGMK